MHSWNTVEHWRCYLDPRVIPSGGTNIRLSLGRLILIFPVKVWLLSCTITTPPHPPHPWQLISSLETADHKHILLLIRISPQNFPILYGGKCFLQFQHFSVFTSQEPSHLTYLSSVWTHEFLFFLMVCNLLYFAAQIFPRLVSGGPFKLAPVSLWYVCPFLSTLYLV